MKCRYCKQERTLDKDNLCEDCKANGISAIKEDYKEPNLTCLVPMIIFAFAIVSIVYGMIEAINYLINLAQGI